METSHPYVYGDAERARLVPTEIVPNVYDVTCTERDGRRLRAFLFDTPTPILVDCGLAETTDRLVEGVNATGVTPEQLVITHADPDHIGGFDGVVEAWDLETLVPVGAEPDTEYEPDRQFGDGDVIGPFQAVHAPGHRAHQHVLIDEDRGIAVLADAASGADQRGLPAGYFHLPPGMFSEDLHQAEETLEELATYAFEVGLVYHGSSVLSEASAKLAAYVDVP